MRRCQQLQRVIEAHADEISYVLDVRRFWPMTIHFVDVQAVILVYTLPEILPILAWGAGRKPEIRRVPGIGGRGQVQAVVLADVLQLVPIDRFAFDFGGAFAELTCLSVFRRPAFAVDRNQEAFFGRVGF